MNNLFEKPVKSAIKMKYQASIILNVYNAEKYIESFFNSLINQEIADYKIIVIDDGSDDAVELCPDNYRPRHHQLSSRMPETC